MQRTFCHLQRRDPQAPDVCHAVVPDLLYDLRSHPEGGSDDGVPLGHGVSQLSGHAKVGQLGVALRVEQDVAGLDVLERENVTLRIQKRRKLLYPVDLFP